MRFAMTESTRAAAKRRFQPRLLLARLLLVAGGILVGLSIAEVALRVSGFTYLNPYIVDRDVGFSLRPGAEGWWKQENLTYIKINRNGLRDIEHAIAKPPDTLRIAVLGDSFAEAFQVPLEKTFWSVMERKLQECPKITGSKVEAMNFGISGLSTARELILLRKRVWQYSPDVIVLLVTTGNDIRDNSRALNAYPGLPLPYFVSQNGKLILDDSLLEARNRSLTFSLQQSFIGQSFNWVRNHLRLVGLIDKAREPRQASAREFDRERKAGSIRSVDEPGLAHEVFLEPVSPEWDDAWRVTEGLLVQMRD